MTLLEKDLSLDEALDIFGLEEVPDSRELKKVYAQLSKEHHPDHGGSTEEMILINNAYEVLTKTGEGAKSTEFSQKSWQEEQEAKKIKDKEQYEYMYNMFAENFDEEELLNHLSQFSEDELEVSVDIPEYKGYYTYGASFSANVSVFNSERTLVYSVMFYIAPEVVSSGGLGSPDLDMDDIAYKFSVNVDIFYNNRKQKVSQNAWQWRKGKKVLFDYEEVFPATKLQKIFTSGGKKSFKKADFLLGLQRGIPCKINEERGTYFLHPFEDGDIYFSIARTTMMRTAGYNILNMRGWKNNYKNQLFRIQGFNTLEESEEVMLKMITAFKEAKKLVLEQGLPIKGKEDSDEIFDLFILAFKAYDLI
jgi:hypothetical protein